MSKKTEVTNKHSANTARNPTKKTNETLPIIPCPEQLFTHQQQKGFPSGEMAAKKEFNPRMWPSARVPQGGLFHAPKFQYSPETTDLIRCK